MPDRWKCTIFQSAPRFAITKVTRPGELMLLPAAGDVARVANRWHGDSPRIEHWTNAVEQAVHAAENALAGPEASTSFSSVPYFWSDQYDQQDPVHRWRTAARRDRDRRRFARRPKTDGALPARRSPGGVSRPESAARVDQVQEAARCRRILERCSLGTGRFVAHLVGPARAYGAFRTRHGGRAVVCCLERSQDENADTV